MLAVSFISLGMRAGFVVALSIPLVLAITFTVMAYLGISLQRISLGALIIALGPSGRRRHDRGRNDGGAAGGRRQSAQGGDLCLHLDRLPMLTGTLVTVAGFIPIGLNNSAAGEYTFTLFVVIAVSLLVSWIVAVLFAPLLGVTILPATMKQQHHDQPGRFDIAVPACPDRLRAPSLADHHRHGAVVCRLDRRLRPRPSSSFSHPPTGRS